MNRGGGGEHEGLQTTIGVLARVEYDRASKIRMDDEVM